MFAIKRINNIVSIFYFLFYHNKLPVLLAFFPIFFQVKLHSFRNTKVLRDSPASFYKIIRLKSDLYEPDYLIVSRSKYCINIVSPNFY